MRDRPTPRLPHLLLAAVALGWVFAFANYWIFIVTAALVTAIAALGLMVVVGWNREISLAHGALVGTAVYWFSYLYRGRGGWGWPFLAAATATVLTLAALMALVSLICVKLPGIYVMVLTLGLQMLLDQTVLASATLTGGVLGDIKTPRPRVFGLSVESDRGFYFLILACLAIVFLLLRRLRFSRYGRGMLLVGTSRHAAAAVGISPWRYKMFAFVISGVLAALAGVLSAILFRSVPPPGNYTTLASLSLLAIPVLAGFDSRVAVIAVAVGFGLAPQGLERFHINVFVLGGVGVVAGILLGARGLAGRVAGLSQRFRRHDVAVRRLARLEARSGDAEVTVKERALATLHRYLPAPPSAGGVALQVTDIAVRFGGVHALQGVSLTVPSGSFVGLIGPNGAGKTTLFDVVSGLQRHDRGTVCLFEEDVTSCPAWHRSRLGLTRTFQTPRVMPDLSVADNLLAGSYLRADGGLIGTLAGWPGAWRPVRRAEEAAWALAQLLEIDLYWEEPAGSLHFSVRRRVEIGRVILSGPRLLLLDEPGAGLDPVSTAKLFQLIKELHESLALTVLLVEHYVPVVLDTCDVIHVLDEGRILASGAPDDIVLHAGVQDRYLGCR